MRRVYIRGAAASVSQKNDRALAEVERDSRKSPGLRMLAVSAALALALGAMALPGCTGSSSSSAVSATSATAEASADSGDNASDAPTSGSASSDALSGEASGGQGGSNGGADTMTYDYSGTYTAPLVADGTEVASGGETIAASEPDQNVALARNGGVLRASGATFQKSGDDTDGDRCNFYGANSIALAVGENSKVLLTGSQLASSSEGSNALFATNKGTMYANDVTIATTADSSRGADATYGGTIVANNLNVTTQGDHCAAVATDRGGGSVSVANSTLSTAGSGSPVLYSTGDIEVNNVSGTSSGSQLVGMEGLNSVAISNSKLTSTQSGKTASDPIANGVIIYQSTSGDAEAVTGDAALFQATSSVLESSIDSGALFYLTNTKAKVVLANTELLYDSDAAKLMVVAGNASNNWGSAGSNGATATFTGIGQTLAGDVEVDTISSLDFYLLSNSVWKGASSITENSAQSASGNHITVNVDASSTWTVTANSTVTNLNVAAGGKLVDADGKAIDVVDADGNKLVEGASKISVKVTGDFSTTVKTSAANEPEASSIDRASFDAEFGTTTTF